MSILVKGAIGMSVKSATDLGFESIVSHMLNGMTAKEFVSAAVKLPADLPPMENAVTHPNGMQTGPAPDVNRPFSSLPEFKKP